MISEDDFYGDTAAQYLESLRNSRISHSVSTSTVLAYCFLAVAAGYHMLQYFDYPVLPISELAWNILVYLMPCSVVSALDRRMDGTNLDKRRGDSPSSSSRLHAMKSEAVRHILGLSPGGILGKVQQVHSLSGVGRLLPGKRSKVEDGAPPGLGNWDNSCYQNSVIQGLASLPSLPDYLARLVSLKGSFSTAAALRTIITDLNNPSNVGLMFWTPAELKTMNSWQQQDAQEYFSRVLDEIGKEFTASQEEQPNCGGLASFSAQPTARIRFYRNGDSRSGQSTIGDFLGSFRGTGQFSAEIGSSLISNPLEGLLAQRVGCLKCGYVEGLSLIPFNCLTVPLGKEWLCDIRTCLDDYTALEPIAGVECVKCTLSRNKVQLERLLSQTQDASSVLNETPLVTQALQTSIQDRLSAVEKALDDDDFSDNAILKRCQIPANRRVSVTKSRQAVIARAPKSLVIHVNRSVFDEATGMQSKNFADVKFPEQLDLAPWCLGRQISGEKESETIENWSIDPSKSMHSLEAEDTNSLESDNTSPSSQQLYNLRAVITHYGRHENGHYICYRKCGSTKNASKDPSREKPESWWCLSDEEVSRVSEHTVLDQRGVFMLFYEKLELAKDPVLDSPKGHDAALLGSLERPLETVSEKKSVTVDDSVQLENIKANHIAGVEKDWLIGIADEDRDSASVVQHSTKSCLSEAFEPTNPIDPAKDDNPVSPQPPNSLHSPTRPLENSHQAFVSEEAAQERTATSETNPSEACPNTISSTELSTMQSPAQKPVPTEPSSPEIDEETELPDPTISTTTTISASSNSSSLETMPASQLDDRPKESPKLNPHHHPPMRTASPRSSRGNGSRAGKAMSNVSAMVTAN